MKIYKITAVGEGTPVFVEVGTPERRKGGKKRNS